MHDAHHTLATQFSLCDEAATLAFGARFATHQCLTPGLVIWLHGDLGAGKTTFVRGLLRALGETGPVKSPTYTLLEVHAISGLNLYHFDFYRLNQPEEYLDAGLDEYFSGNGVCLVEWPDQAAPYLPPADIHIELRVVTTPGSPTNSPVAHREAFCHATSARGRLCLTRCCGIATPSAATSSSLPPPA
ncbi:tRNA (adenosine(37)-N6)-threonylcarbamoyltransferase complex ATPase subunit type 1 TsaE [Rugosibacter aromaticivorans]|uniref:tRNA (adenosine(37)-N6)-threonylcarbamoyltransferase complex ATPase subunit type 1 TsaE n=1 Tax=Rugosibacter aromaticivorans TaxID=1565605 RepID=UPI001F028758|nr:tRNA (adenosine(37)-N6)-threonylcarbamoyltransferase complex ATPase subunit type 1 TsaE [Rugosibacter aromaticivorans]